MVTRALLAFLALPGVVAIAVPVIWLRATSHTKVVQPLGLVLLVAGACGLLWCVRDFYVWGKGTVAPWAPPARLVRTGAKALPRSWVAASKNGPSSRGCREFASDAALGNELSHAVHRSLGFRETERVVYFRKLLHAR